MGLISMNMCIYQIKIHKLYPGKSVKFAPKNPIMACYNLICDRKIPGSAPLSGAASKFNGFFLGENISSLVEVKKNSK